MTTLIGRWGRLAEVRTPRPPRPVAHTRPSHVSTALYGGRWVRQAPASRRTWEWDLAGLPDADVADLEQLFHDSAREALWWMDPTAVGVNMVRHDVAEPQAGVLGSDDVALVDAGAAQVDGRTWDMVDGQQSIDVPTVEGTTYRALVRASAQSTLTVESLDGDRAVLVTVGQAANPVSNPSFETGDLTGWAPTTSGTATVSVVSDAAATEGDFVVEMEDPDGSSQVFIESDPVPAAEGEVWTASVHVVSFPVAGTASLAIWALDGADAFISQVALQSFSTVGRHTVTSSALPAGTASVAVLPRVTVGNAATVRFDAVQLDEGDTASTFSPGLSGEGLLAAEWAAGTEAGVRVAADGDGWSGLQMFDAGLYDGTWRPGRGIPQVRLEGLTAGLLWALDNGDVRWRDVQVRLVEVDS